MSRRLFTAGCWVLIATGLVHLAGHYSLVNAQGDTEAERQLLSLMRGNAQDMGLGFVRSTFDILTGFSLTFSILPAGMGLVGLLLRRHEGRAPGLLRPAAVAYAGVYGVMTAVAFRYWFPAPLFFLAAAFLCFAAAVATAPRARA
ncbi:MAG TPA: hypothetical protein VGB87_23345 [Vicinamibacteria bacterium]